MNKMAVTQLSAQNLSLACTEKQVKGVTSTPLLQLQSHFIVLFVFIRNQFGMERFRRAFIANLLLITNRLWAAYVKKQRINSNPNVSQGTQLLFAATYHVVSRLVSLLHQRYTRGQYSYAMEGGVASATWVCEWRKRVGGKSATLKHSLDHGVRTFGRNVIVTRFESVLFLV